MILWTVIYSLIITGEANNGCFTGSIRLIGGVLHNEGRLEACYNGDWGTVCGEGWTQIDVDHLCSRLGYPQDGATISSYGEGNGSVYNLTCVMDGINCRRSLVRPSDCPHSLDLGVRCQTFLPACNAAINETLSSLTTPPPVECPTIVTITNRDPSDSAQIGLIFAVVVLVAALTLALAGWIMTCLALKIRIYKLTKGHTHAGTPTPSETAYELNNPVYETGGGGANNTPPPQVYEIVDEGENKTISMDTKEDTP